jgi:Tfp pilus assembly protein PilF
MSNSTTPTTNETIPWGRLALLIGSIVAIVIAVRSGWAEWTAQDHYRDALKLIDARNFAEASKKLELCAKAWPSSAEIAFLQARTSRRGGNLLLAEEQLQRAERLEWVPDAITFERTLLRTHQGFFRQTEESLVRAVRNDHPDSILVLELIAPYYARIYSTGLAREMLNKWIELEPKNPAPYLWLGDVYAKMNLGDAARESYLKALETAPENPTARLRVARQFITNRQAEKAIPYLEELIKIDPLNQDTRLLQAQAYSELGRRDEARSLLDSLMKEIPDDPGLLLQYGQFELRDQRFANAEVWFRKAYAKAPFDTPIILGLAQCLEADRPEEAAKLRERFKQIEVDMKELSDLRRRVILESNNVEVRLQIGVILKRNEQFEAALDWVKTALDLAPRSPKVHQELAELYDKLKDPDKANQHREWAKKYK